jgi:hypothetical protein
MAMLDSLPAEPRPAQTDCDELPATRSRFASAEKFPPLVRLGIFLVGSVASWGVFVLLLRLLFRAF